MHLKIVLAVPWIFSPLLQKTQAAIDGHPDIQSAGENFLESR